MNGPRWAFFILLGVQWLLVFPMTVYASERFEDMYEFVDEGSEPLLVLPADPDAALHFGIHMVALVAISLLLLYLRHRQGRGNKLSSVLLFIPPMACLALRFWVGCITCTP